MTTDLTTNLTTPDDLTTDLTTRVARKLRNINRQAIDELAASENLSTTEMTRLLLSYGTYKWSSTNRHWAVLDDTLSIKLLPAGIDAIKTLADQEAITWDAMASQLLAFATATWPAGWRKDQPGTPSTTGIHQILKPSKAA